MRPVMGLLIIVALGILIETVAVVAIVYFVDQRYMVPYEAYYGPSAVVVIPSFLNRTLLPSSEYWLPIALPKYPNGTLKGFVALIPASEELLNVTSSFFSMPARPVAAYTIKYIEHGRELQREYWIVQGDGG